MPFCIECGQPIADSAAFCTECGRAVQPSAAPASKAAPAPIPQAIQDQVQPAAPPAVSSPPAIVPQAIQDQVRAAIAGHLVEASSLKPETRLEDCITLWKSAPDDCLAEVERACDVIFPVDVPELWQTVGDLERFVAESRAYQSTPASQAAAKAPVSVASDKTQEPSYYVLEPNTFIGGRMISLNVDEAAWVSGVCVNRLKRQLQSLLPDWVVFHAPLSREWDGFVELWVSRRLGQVGNDYRLQVRPDGERRKPHEMGRPGYIFRPRTDGRPNEVVFSVYWVSPISHIDELGCVSTFLGGPLAVVLAAVGGWSFYRADFDRWLPLRWLPALETLWVRVLASVALAGVILTLVGIFLNRVWRSWNRSRHRRHFDAGGDLHVALWDAVRKLDVPAALGRPIFEYPAADLRARIQR